MKDSENYLFNYNFKVQKNSKCIFCTLKYEDIEKLNTINNQSLEEQAIINIINNNPLVTQEEIAVLINKSLRTVKNYMSLMQEKGLIKREYGRRTGKWIINN